MVKVCNAFVAGAAVFGFRSPAETEHSSEYVSLSASLQYAFIMILYIHIHLTEGTVKIINDMFMSGVVKHGHGAGVILSAADADVRWIHCDGRHVS